MYHLIAISSISYDTENKFQSLLQKFRSSEPRSFIAMQRPLKVTYKHNFRKVGKLTFAGLWHWDVDLKQQIMDIKKCFAGIATVKYLH